MHRHVCKHRSNASLVLELGLAVQRFFLVDLQAWAAWAMGFTACMPAAVGPAVCKEPVLPDD